ncbi:MAG: cytochrome c, partial [Gammaproteobacteria bacterium]|nr:cytochrome c [Gammaproteobacteria bacterium]
WSTDMMNQPSIKPQEGPPAPFPKHSVPVTGIPTKVKDRGEATDLKNPVKPTAASLKKGRNLFRIICAACHGLDGKASSPVSPKIGAADLTADYIQNYPDGYIWGTISFGGAIMPAYGVPNEQGGSNDLSPEERWHVVNYVKHGLLKEPAVGSVASTK